MVTSGLLSKEDIIRGFMESIRRIEHIEQINAVGIEQILLQNVLRPDGIEPNFKGGVPTLYNEVACFVASMHPHINQIGALYRLNEIRRRYL
ncbi:hypothetical protein HZB03_02420 [Candidatus Woesearchaeota archaeon]|nr:hypothetical protein [Candidatus Woesearchaeota archaeon]